jgi:PmbA protein
MKELLEKALEVADQAEVFHLAEESISASVRNGRLKEMGTSIQSGYSLRIIKDGMLGTAYTKNLLDRGELVRNALASLKGEVEAAFNFPAPAEMAELDTYDRSVSEVTPAELQKRAAGMVGFVDDLDVEGEVSVGVGSGSDRIRIVNSSGLDVSQTSSEYGGAVMLHYPGTETGIYAQFQEPGPSDPDWDHLRRQVELYKATVPQVDIPTGRMKVLFMPPSLYALTWRLGAGASGKSFHTETSPLLGRAGEKVLSEKITVYNDPHDRSVTGARSFDDEGVATRRLEVFDRGVFRTPYVNLDYAGKLGMEPTATGYRGSMWGGETVAYQPAPSLRHLRFAYGDKDFDQMVAAMDRGVVVFGLLGAHSGNILNGDLSVGLNPGFYVEDGKIRGRVRDGMVAGNAYDMLRNVAAVQNGPYNPADGSRHPCILLDDVSVSTRKG